MPSMVFMPEQDPYHMQLLGRINLARLGGVLWLHNGGSSRDETVIVHTTRVDSIIVGNNMRCDNDGVGFPAFYAKMPVQTDQWLEHLAFRWIESENCDVCKFRAMHGR